MLCSIENTWSTKELHIDPSSHNYLLFIKLHLTPESGLSVCQWDRIFSDAHLPGSNNRLEALSQPIKTGWGRKLKVNCALIHLPMLHLWFCGVTPAPYVWVCISLQYETKLSEFVLHSHSSKHYPRIHACTLIYKNIWSYTLERAKHPNPSDLT